MTAVADAFRGEWKSLAAAFLKLGIMSYGGGAMMGIMHAEVVERRRWLSDERYLEGVGLVTMLPGPPAVQLAIFVGYARAGWCGGILAGLCFMLPAFFQLLGLTLLYSAYGSLEVIRGALYGMAPVVLAIFIAAVYRLGRSTLNAPGQVAIAVVAGLLVASTPVSVVATLLAAGCAALALGRFRVQGLVAGLVVIAVFALFHWLQDVPATAPVPTGGIAGSVAPSLGELAAFFLKVGAFTFGGGLAMVALVQEHVVNQVQWLSSREFLDGLALGQLTPGPTLMIAAYVGYKVAGVAGAVVGASTIFLPAFVLMLCVLPMLERFAELSWIKPAIRGISAAVIGCLVVTLLQLLPQAAPDVVAIGMLLAATGVAVVWRAPPLPLILVGAMLGLALRITI